ncbi:hypothetical protein B0H14DRAFT_2637170 [Mycena olivaceomarginata]|nr:hypothetical protein B0H14DRAFT_2637170 [Mycena olivaceomarginata]
MGFLCRRVKGISSLSSNAKKGGIRMVLVYKSEAEADVERNRAQEHRHRVAQALLSSDEREVYRTAPLWSWRNAAVEDMAAGGSSDACTNDTLPMAQIKHTRQRGSENRPIHPVAAPPIPGFLSPRRGARICASRHNKLDTENPLPRTRSHNSAEVTSGGTPRRRRAGINSAHVKWGLRLPCMTWRRAGKCAREGPRTTTVDEWWGRAQSKGGSSSADLLMASWDCYGATLEQFRSRIVGSPRYSWT